MQWFKECALNRPTIVESPPKCAPLQPGDFRPALNCKCHPIARDKVVPSGIAGLLSWCRPSAIVRLVIAVIIDPVNRVEGRRALAHIGQKRRKGVQPLFAYGDSAPAVVFIIPMLRAVTSTLHALPRRVFRRVASEMSEMAAWAARIRIVPEVVDFDRPYVSAFAPAEPACGFAPVGPDVRLTHAQNRKISELLSGFDSILLFRHLIPPEDLLLRATVAFTRDLGPFPLYRNSTARSTL
jgi:hypothetical protein